MAKKEESSNSTNLSEETKQMTQRSSSQKVKEIKEKDLKDEIILTKKDMKKTDTPLITFFQFFFFYNISIFINNFF